MSKSRNIALSKNDYHRMQISSERNSKIERFEADLGYCLGASCTSLKCLHDTISGIVG